MWPGLTVGWRGRVFVAQRAVVSDHTQRLASPRWRDVGLWRRGYTAINNQGNVAFTFGLDPFFPPELEGFPKAGLYRYSHVTETLSAVVVPLVTPAPGFGVFQSTGQHASLNNNGEIVFPGVVPTSAGTSPHLGQGIFVADEHGHISEVVVPGDPAPGGGVFDYSVNPWINDGGDVAFSAHVKSDPCIPVSLLGPGCGESIYFNAQTRQTFNLLPTRVTPHPVAVITGSRGELC